MNQEKVGNLIKKIRLDNNLTQKEFAEKFGVTYQAVSKWENGKNLPDIETLKLICDTYNYNINNFLEGNNKKKVNYILLFILIIIIFTVIYLIFINKDSYEFKQIISSDDNITINGVVAFSDKKSSIYISNIDILDDSDNYQVIECTLYENIGNVTKKISSCEKYSKDSGSDISSLLKDITFKVDDFTRSCKNFKNSSLFLEINGINENNQTIKYEVPLKIEDTCS